MINKIKLVLILCVISYVFTACNVNNTSDTTQVDSTVQVHVPTFNQDSAYKFIEEQLAFGPRVPNTKASRACALYLEKKLKQYGFEVTVQEAKVRAYDGKMLEMRNIIGSFKPGINNRVLLCSHWDSRPVADHDPVPDNRKKPVPAANDGASGVGVLLEMARQMQLDSPSVGIDIVFFDCEDTGAPQDVKSTMEDDWCLGSQYFSKNPFRPKYFAKYGILLDMVGASNAKFFQEGISMKYASDVVRKVWGVAYEIGYSDYFINMESSPITDDHVYINQILGIPTIDIIHRDETTGSGFYKHWHTTNDDMQAIDKNTLQVVGHTLMTVVYREK